MSFNVSWMNFKKLFQKEIDFDALKSVGQLLSAKDPGIHSIIFYSGKRDRQYILLIETNLDGADLESFLYRVSFSMRLEHGFLEYQENRDIISKAKQHDYSLEKPFLKNWYIFFKKVSIEEYYLVAGRKPRFWNCRG